MWHITAPDAAFHLVQSLSVEVEPKLLYVEWSNIMSLSSLKYFLFLRLKMKKRAGEIQASGSNTPLDVVELKIPMRFGERIGLDYS